MTEVLLARHGETDWTREKRWQGHGDPQLNAKGLAQARTMAQELAHVPLGAIYSSDLRRAAETAAIVAAVVALEVRPDPGLRENDFGDWTGLTRGEVERRFPDGVRRRAQGLKGWSGGESYDEMAERVVRAVERIASRHGDERVLIVTHNGPIRAVHAHTLGVPYSEYKQTARSIKKGSVSVVTLEDGVWSGIAHSLRGLAAFAPFLLQSLSEWSPALSAGALSL